MHITIRKVTIIVILISLYIAAQFIAAQYVVRAEERRASDPEAEELIRAVWEKNSRITAFQADLDFVRYDADAFRGVLPPLEPRYTNARGMISYINTPRAFRIRLYNKEGDEGFYYTFLSPDGYVFNLDKEYEKMPAIQVLKAAKAETPEPKPEPEAAPDELLSPPILETIPEPQETVTPFGMLSSSSDVDEYEDLAMGMLFAFKDKKGDGSLVFDSTNPINLMIPFSFKNLDPNSRMYYAGKGASQGYSCHMVDIGSPLYGNSRIYISDDDNNYVVQVDRRNPQGYVYATGLYSDFKKFRKGGWVYQTVRISANFRLVFESMAKNWVTADDLVEDRPTAVLTPVQPPVRRPSDLLEIWIPSWTIRTVLIVIILMTLLTFLFYRYWFFKEKRAPFARELIIVEGERPDEKFGEIFTGLGIPVSEFTAEKLTEERNLLEAKGTKRPRVVLIGPGMFTYNKAYNFLLKAYVKDGGRVIIFEHGMEHVKDMPFTPTFIPFDRTDLELKFTVSPKWKDIWKQTSLEEIQKRTAAFTPYEIIAKIEENTIEIDPIITVNNPATNINAGVVVLLREGKGEYLVVQYRLLEAVKKLKFTSATAEKMLIDLISYMMGEEKRLEFAPLWLQKMLGIIK